MTKIYTRKSSIPYLTIGNVEGLTFDAVVATTSTFKGRLELRVRSKAEVVFTCDDNWPNDVTSTFIVTLRNKALIDTVRLVEAVDKWNAELEQLVLDTWTRHEPKLKIITDTQEKQDARQDH